MEENKKIKKIIIVTAIILIICIVGYYLYDTVIRKDDYQECLKEMEDRIVYIVGEKDEYGSEDELIIRRLCRERE